MDRPSAPQLRGQKILIVGVTGKVAMPVARALAGENEVWGAARFSDPASRDELEQIGVRCAHVDMIDGDFDECPADADYVLNFSVVKTKDWSRDLAGNVGGLGRLMFHCAQARAVLHCSSTAVYQPDGHRRLRETDGLGDNHRPLTGMHTYSISKIAAEAMASFCAQQLSLPTTIARLNVPYGTRGLWPANHVAAMLAGQPINVHADAPSEYNPIHIDDIIGTIPGLLAAASVPATIVNWGGNDTVSIEEWCTYLGELVGVEPILRPTADTIESVAVDVSELHRLVGPLSVSWRDGMRRMVTELELDGTSR
jgi:nucleoside-diphosphate-sugar epimerase